MTAGILHALHPLAWVGLAMLAAAPVLAIGGFLTAANNAWDRLNAAAIGIGLVVLAYAFIGGGAVMVRVG